MKAVILAGGLGTRISEESYLIPKPMIEIGGKPIIWHIMKLYLYHGCSEFIICAGYKQQIIKKWFADYFIYSSDITFDFSQDNKIIVHNRFYEPWKVTIVDTGLNTGTGGRIKKVREYIGDEPFFLTYGDGVSDVNIKDTVRFHNQHGKLATLTAVKQDNCFGVMDIQGDRLSSFREKNPADAGWINGGFMVLNPKVIDYISGDGIMFEKEPLEQLAAQGELMCYKHDGFWQCMDNLRDKEKLESMWNRGEALWKVWAQT